MQQLINEEADHNGGAVIDEFFRAVVECVEESVYNALVAAEIMIGRGDHTVHALSIDKLVGLMRHYRRLD